jgi:hypothetical protein
MPCHPDAGFIRDAMNASRNAALIAPPLEMM